MVLSFLLPKALVFNLHYYVFFALCAITSLNLIRLNETQILKPSKWSLPGAALLCIFAGFIATQIVTFDAEASLIDINVGDIALYRVSYEWLQQDFYAVDWDVEWGWKMIITICRRFGFSVWDWFMLIRVIYIGCMLLSCWLLMRGKEWTAILFSLYSFGFMGGAVNGLRIGVASSLVGLSIALIDKQRLWKVVALLLMIAAISIHKSIALPVVSIVVAWLFRLPIHVGLFIWLVSIPVSLLTGNAFGEWFATFDVDERMSHYFFNQQNEEIMAKFSHVGFRWDFLLYSTAPVVFVVYLMFVRNFKDRLFGIIANGYLIANAFWILVIRASFSNRFAALSWFLFPILFAYPLLRFKIWEDQDRKVGLILLAYASFTFLMYIRG